jgi:hypothetical protein
MPSEMMQQVLRVIENEAQLRPGAAEYELAYQARVAIDRIRFAIRQTKQFAPRTDEIREAGPQLLDALDRLQSADRRFPERFRVRSANVKSEREETMELTTEGSKRDGRICCLQEERAYVGGSDIRVASVAAPYD